ncbi:sulfite exporter TauE/SafE family protein [Marinobacter sp. 1_MG-2023]|uniref:sulfite exporter TauE/SafE family protein n=1 Tax=Marinobacter sp. 1_MG-2023 TaxID=3062627 RepID=UPI0026E29A15|nr:sulfite exporter TauE/SafE family protein [Marinobacter sp. 1_MG-2023]MDO6824817.1 sulfite exporter TauE/SafE family protein [Marinobacter sp. 1_MG-2023]
MIDPWLWLGLAILLAYTIEAITGFGSIVIALSLGAIFLPIPEMLPVLVPLNVFMSGYLTWKHRQHIDWRLLTALILPLMVAGTFTGYVLTPWLGTSLLKALFGALVVWFAGKELWRLFGGHVARPHGLMTSRILTFGAGITHGLFASGGPLLVYALAGIQQDKSRTRATLLAVWFTLNLTLSVLYLFDGSLLNSAGRLVWYLPLLVVGVLVGEFFHQRLDETRFRQAVYCVLLVTGLLLIVRA